MFNFDTEAGVANFLDLVINNQIYPDTPAEAEMMFQKRQQNRIIMLGSTGNYMFRNAENISNLSQSMWNSGKLGKTGEVGTCAAAGAWLIGFIVSWYEDWKNCQKILKEGEVINEEEMPLTRAELK